VTKSPAPPGLLESNRKPVHDLQHLLELIGQRRVERELNVHRTTVRRWLQGTVAIPGAQRLAIRALLGDLPGTAGKWSGWRFHDGRLLSPAGDAYRPGDILSLTLLRQQLTAQRLDIERLRARLAVAESGLPQAANDAGAHERRQA
jgi:hypothetical protein